MAGQPLSTIQWITLCFFAVAIVACWLYEARRKNAISGVPFLVYAVHGLFYYLSLHLSYSRGWYPLWNDMFDFQQWSAALRMHGALTIAFVFGFEAWEQRRVRRIMLRARRRIGRGD